VKIRGRNRVERREPQNLTQKLLAVGGAIRDENTAGGATVSGRNQTCENLAPSTTNETRRTAVRKTSGGAQKSERNFNRETKPGRQIQRGGE
jgi:hypothetical protein